MTVRLTPRERQILELVAAGLSIDQIASRQNVSPSTVKSQRKTLYRRLGATCAAHAVAIGFRTGLLSSEESSR